MIRPKLLKTKLVALAVLLGFVLTVAIPTTLSTVLPRAFQHADAATTDCTDVFTPLNSFITQDAAANQSVYIQAMNATGVPWALLAAIHYRETNFSLTEPGNGQGLFQDGYAVAGAGTILNGNQFYQEALHAAQIIQSSYVFRNSPNAAASVTPRALTSNEQDINLIKNTLYSWNGRAGSYAQQATNYGFNASLQPYEGSPYVMNRFDCQRDRMGIITQDGGAISGLDTRYGAFTVYARLQGDAYWLSMLQPYTWGLSSQEAYTDSGYTTEYTDPANPTVAPGQKAYLKLVARNIGQNTWSQGVVHLGTTYPGDRASVFDDGSWLSPQRIGMQEASVIPGGTATFQFSITAPTIPGTYVEHFSLVADGITWLNDPDIYYTIDVANPVLATNTQNTSLSVNQYLLPGDRLMSPDSQNVLTLLPNGNVALYSGLKQIWNNGVNNPDAQDLVMQSDGNLVEYSSSGALWASGTGGANNYLSMQSDGNVTIRTSGGSSIWSTNTPSVPDYLSKAVSSVPAGGVMYPGQFIQTADRAYTLVLQPGDGNLVEYNSAGHAVWASGTSGGNDVAVMQGDGNFVVYGSGGKALWASGTGGGGNSLTLQPGGVLAITNGNNAILWSGHALYPGQFIQTADHAYALVMQSDGNLVEYASNGHAVWASGTSGRNDVVVMQSDGNLVIYGTNGRPLWATSTSGRGSVFALQTDGNMVIYGSNGHPLWSR